MQTFVLWLFGQNRIADSLLLINLHNTLEKQSGFKATPFTFGSRVSKLMPHMLDGPAHQKAAGVVIITRQIG